MKSAVAVAHHKTILHPPKKDPPKTNRPPDDVESKDPSGGKTWNRRMVTAAQRTKVVAYIYVLC